VETKQGPSGLRGSELCRLPALAGGSREVSRHLDGCGRGSPVEHPTCSACAAARRAGGPEEQRGGARGARRRPLRLRVAGRAPCL